MIVREYICMDFSKNNDEYLYAGTTSGDFVVIQIKSKTMSGLIQVTNSGNFHSNRHNEYNIFIE